MNEILAQLIEFLKSASPLVWQTLIKQIYSDAIATLAWAVGCIVISFFLVKLGKYGTAQREDDEYNTWEIAYFFGYIGAVVSGLVSFGLTVYACQMLVNPEFYAIQYLIAKFHR